MKRGLKIIILTLRKLMSEIYFFGTITLDSVWLIITNTIFFLYVNNSIGCVFYVGLLIIKNSKI